MDNYYLKVKAAPGAQPLFYRRKSLYSSKLDVFSPMFTLGGALKDNRNLLTIELATYHAVELLVYRSAVGVEICKNKSRKTL